MKKLQNLSLLAATFLASFLIYSCMKEESIATQQLPTTELQKNETTGQNLTEQSVAATEQIKIVNNTSKKSGIKKISDIGASIANNTTSVDDEPCGATPKGKGCVTTNEAVTITIPATELNPFNCTAVAKFVQTICSDDNGNTTITIQLTEVSPNFDCDIFDYWINLPDPDFAVAFDEFFNHGSFIIEDIVLNGFMGNNPNKSVVDSELYKTMCYKACIYLVEGHKSSTMSQCGQICCKRKRTYTRLSNGTIVKSTPTYSSLGVCDSNSLGVPCEGAIKSFPTCSGSCDPNRSNW